ncbi:MAG TPA: MarR family transcriptional regulator [Levilinea sp.]|nr:MarR family transcriptional regulator [Levilinea sp.]
MPVHYKGSPETTLALDTYIKLTRANSAFEARLLAHGDLGNITISQFGVLEALHHLGAQCQGAISQKLLKSTGNMTLVIDNLEKQGLVRRNRSLEDRRQVMIELMPQGEELIKEMFPRHAAAITQEMSVLSIDEQRILGRLLRKLGLGLCEKAGQAQNSDC